MGMIWVKFSTVPRQPGNHW